MGDLVCLSYRLSVSGDVPKGKPTPGVFSVVQLYWATVEPQSIGITRGARLQSLRYSKIDSATRTLPALVSGDGPMAEELRIRVRALGLTDGVTFHGVVTDPTPLLTRCRIFVLPSRFEGTPNALLEAMGQRMACIVSDASPGPLRLIEHGVSGLVVETGSVEALAGALGELSRDEQLPRKLGDAAFERVREFRLDRVAPIWDRILFPDEPAAAAKR